MPTTPNNTYEWNGNNGIAPDMMRLGTSEYYLIVSQGSDGDGWANTSHVWNSNGTIQQTTIDSLEFDTVSCVSPNIVHVSGDVYAVAYANGTASVVKTFTADDANGNIGAAIVDSIMLKYRGNYYDIINITGNIYAVTYANATAALQGWIETVYIDSSGNIGATTNDSINYNSTGQYWCGRMTQVDTNTVAIVYDEATSMDGWIVTYNISSTGDITNTYADRWEFDGGTGLTPTIKNINGDTYAIAYRAAGPLLKVATVNITDTGDITTSWTDTLTVSSAAVFPTLFTINDNSLYGVTQQGTDADGFVRSMNISSTGMIDASFADSMEFDTADCVWWASISYVNKSFYYIVYTGTGNDGWSCTVNITTNYLINGISNPSPANASIGIGLSPECSISIADAQGDSMTLTWAENSTGSFVNRQTNASCANGTYRWDFIQATSYSTKYWWKVYVNDGTTNITAVYHFTTLFSTTGVWYVSPTGSDTTGIGSFSNPFHTIRKAINASSTSDTIYLRGGEYDHIYSTTTGILINRSGISSSWYTITGYPGEIAIIDATGYASLASNYGVLNCGQTGSPQTHIRISNIQIRNVSGLNACSAIRGWGYYGSASGVSHHIRIDNCTFDNIKYNTLKFWTENSDYRPNNITIENCTFNYTSWNWGGGTGYTGESVTLYNTERFVIKDNRFTICYKSMIDCANGTRNGLIFRNTFSNGTSSTRHAIYLDGSEDGTPVSYNTNISIYNNLIYSPFRGAICLGNEQNGGNNNITIYNNIINSTSTSSVNYGIFFEQPSGGSGISQIFDNIHIKHNTISIRNEGYPLYFDTGVLDAEIRNIKIANNIFQSAGGGDYQIYSGSLASTSSKITRANNLYNHTSKDENTFWTDGTSKFEASAIRLGAEFVDRAAGNLHLNASSPAIGAASATYGVLFDYDSVPRPQGGTYDIGALEYIAGGGTSYAPVQTTPVPVNGTSSVSLPITRLNITVTDQNADPLNVYFRSNWTGAWTTLSSNLTVLNGTYSCLLPGFTGYTKKWWSACVTDGSVWTNRTYWFSPSYPTEGITLDKDDANWTTSSSVYLDWYKGTNATNTYIYRSETGYLNIPSLIYGGTNTFYNDTLRDPSIRYYYTLKPYNSVSGLFGSPFNVSLVETDNATAYGSSWIGFKGYGMTDKTIGVRFTYGDNQGFASLTGNNTVNETGLSNKTGTTAYSDGYIFQGYYCGQVFKTSTRQYYIYNVTVKAMRDGTPLICYAYLYSANSSTWLPSGSVLSSGSCNAGSWGPTGNWANITMSSYRLLTNTRYAIVLRVSGSSINKLIWYRDLTSSYGFGQYFRSTDYGATYANVSGRDALFKIWGHEQTTLLTGSNTTWSLLTTTGAFTKAQTGLNAGQIYYYRANGNDTKGNMTRGNTRFSLTNPGVPTYLALTPTYSNSSLNISWLPGPGANRTLIVRGTTDYPESPTDGTILYNGTGTSTWLTNISFNTSYKLSLFSFTVWGALSRFSTGAMIPWGGVSFICYNESSGLPIGCNVLISNKAGDQVYYGPDLYGYTFINTSEIPMGDDIGFYVSNSSTNKTLGIFNARIYYFDIEPDVFYNFSFYLPVRNSTTTPDYPESYLYYLHVVETVSSGDYQYDSDVEGVNVTIKRYIVSTDSFKTIASLRTDAAGYCNVYLYPNEFYKVFLSKDGYEVSVADYIPAPPNSWGQTETKLFRIVIDTSPDSGDELEKKFWTYITFTGQMYENDTIFMTYIDTLANTTNAQFYLYEEYNGTLTLKNTTGTINDFYYYWFGVLNHSRVYKLRMSLNQTDFGWINITITINPFTTPSDDRRRWIEDTSSDIFGAFEPGYVNFFVIFCSALACLLIPGHKNLEVGIVLTGLVLGLISIKITLPWQLLALVPFIVFIGILFALVKHGKVKL